MRNLIQYPVDENEVIQTLDDAIEKELKSVGGTQAMILTSIKDALLENKEILAKIVESCRA